MAEDYSVIDEARILALAAAVFSTVNMLASVDFSSDVDDEFDASVAVRARKVPEPEEPQ